MRGCRISSRRGSPWTAMASCAARIMAVLRLHPALAPFKAAVLPLSKKLGDKAREIQSELSKDWMGESIFDVPDAAAMAEAMRGMGG